LKPQTVQTSSIKGSQMSKPALASSSKLPKYAVKKTIKFAGIDGGQSPKGGNSDM